jgi:hypothetical protein
VGWSWSIESDIFEGIEEMNVAPVDSGGTSLELAERFAESINSQGCTADQLLARALEDGGTTYLSVRIGGTTTFDLCVGPPGGPTDCCPTHLINDCSFNPTMEELPVSEQDCNGNGQDDLIDILFEETSQDVNHNGIPDECEAGACCLDVELCEVMIGLDCQDQGGDYVGPDVPCDPNPCLVDAVDDVSGSPGGTALLGARPNPFQGSTDILFRLAAETMVDVSIYDAGGRLVRTLASKTLSAGEHTVMWDGDLDGGGQAGAGVYLCRFRAGGVKESVKIFLYR